MTADRLFGIAGAATPLEESSKGVAVLLHSSYEVAVLFAVYGAMCLPSVK